MAEKRVCQQCGTELPDDAPQGVCPYCVFKLGSGAGGNPTSPYPPGSPLPAMEDLAALFPQLEIIGLVGRGGMGVVYKARQPSLDRLVALKILPLDVGRDPTFAERFSREARALAKLSHPNIVAIFDSGQAGGLYYFIMEFVDGVNLRQAILAEQISPPKALAIVPQICDALQYAHEEGVVHRDIKPENVLLDRKGRVKVADFGLAKLLGMAAKDITLTGTSQAMGTLHYMAPEQYEKPQTVDHRADIYSLGVVFYELLTGKLPLGRFELPSEKVHIDVRLDQVVLKTLEREPERRYQYVSEVKDEVQTIGRGAPQFASAGATQPAERIAPATPRRPSSEGSISDRGRALIILGVLALGLSPLLLCIMGVVVPAMQASNGPTWLGIALLSLVILAAFFGGITMIVVGLLSKRGDAADDPSVPPQKQAVLAPVEREAVAAHVRWPGLGLYLVATASVVALLIFALRIGDHMAQGDGAARLTLWGAAQVAIALVVAVGGHHMRNLRSYRWAIAASIVAMLPIHFGFFFGLPIGIWSLVVLSRPQVRRAFGVADHASGTRHPGPMVGAVVVCLLLFLFCGGLLVGAGFPGRQATVYSPPVPYKPVDTPTTHDHVEGMTTADVYVGPDIEWTDGIPRLGPGIISRMGNASQHEAINEALKQVFEEYRAIEETHTTRTINEQGHQVVKVSPFPKDLNRLEDKFWTDVDAIVTDNGERGQLRDKLPIRTSILAYGEYERVFQIWKIGAWYHYTYPGVNTSFKGPELSPEIQRLYKADFKPEEPKPPAEKQGKADH